MNVNIYIEQEGQGFRKQLRAFGAVVEFIKRNGTPETREVFGLEEATQNQIILMALKEAIGILTRDCDITIYMDNEYVASSIGQGRMAEWKSNDWNRKRGAPLANIEEWKALDMVMNEHNITFMQVKKHQYSEYLMSEIVKMKNNRIRWEQQKII